MSDLSMGAMRSAEKDKPRTPEMRWAVYERVGPLLKDLLGLARVELSAAYHAEWFYMAAEWVRGREGGFRRYMIVALGENLGLEGAEKAWEKFEEEERQKEKAKS